jgi:hypothetical protein
VFPFAAGRDVAGAEAVGDGLGHKSFRVKPRACLTPNTLPHEST